MYAIVVNDSMIMDTKPFPYDNEEFISWKNAISRSEWEWCPDENMWMPVYSMKVVARKITKQEWKRHLALMTTRKTRQHQFGAHTNSVHISTTFDDCPF